MSYLLAKRSGALNRFKLDDKAPRQHDSAAAGWCTSNESAPHRYTALAWDMTCGRTSNHSDAVQCRNLSTIPVAVVIDDTHFGDNASELAPRLIHGSGVRWQPNSGEIAWVHGTRSQPEGSKAIRMYAVASAYIGGRPGRVGLSEDNILAGWNGTGYDEGTPCSGVLTQTFNGIWWQEASKRLGDQSERFFATYAAMGGELDELILDTELHNCLDDGGCLYDSLTN